MWLTNLCVFKKMLNATVQFTTTILFYSLKLLIFLQFRLFVDIT